MRPEIGEVNIKVWGRWWTALHRLQSVDPVSRHVRLTGPSCWTLPFRHRKKTPFLVENHPGALDAPGEWQADLRRDVLGIVPLPGVDLSRARVEVPVTWAIMSSGLVKPSRVHRSCPVAVRDRWATTPAAKGTTSTSSTATHCCASRQARHVRQR